MELGKRWRQIDFFIPLILFLIVGYGVLSLGNAMAPQGETESGFIATLSKLNTTYVRLQLMWFFTGLIWLALVMFVDYEHYATFADVMYWISIAVLALVLILGKVTNGAQSWFAVGNTRAFQPSEIAKVTLIILLAKKISVHKEGIKSLQQFIPIIVYFAIPLALVVLQPDIGTALVYLFVFFFMVFAGGLNLKLFGIMIGSAIAFGSAFVLFVLNQAQKNRFLIFLDPQKYKDIGGGQLLSAQTAIGSGQFSGKGMFSPGALSQLDLVPEETTDFIFSISAETFGFVGCVILLTLYVALLGRMVVIAFTSKDKFGSLIVVGVAAMLFFHVFENIGMNLGLMPITGIPLPFVSYGGSNMWTNMMAVGLVMNVAWRRYKFRHDAQIHSEMPGTLKRRAKFI